MSVPLGHGDERNEALPQSSTIPDWTIRVSDIRTVKVSNVSLAATARDIEAFFSVSGEIQYVEMRRESETTQLAYVTFKEPKGADTAILHSGATVADFSVTITPVEDDYKLPPEAIAPELEPRAAGAGSAVKTAEDMVSTVLAKGFVLGKDAINKAKALDERIHLTSNASATVASIDRKMGLSEKLSIGTTAVNEKVKEMDEQFQVSHKTKSALSAAEQKASNTGSAIMTNQYISTAASWVFSAFNAVANAAEDVSVITKEKVEKAEEDKREVLLVRERTEIVDDLTQILSDESPAAAIPLVVPVDSAEGMFSNI